MLGKDLTFIEAIDDQKLLSNARNCQSMRGMRRCVVTSETPQLNTFHLEIDLRVCEEET